MKINHTRKPMRVVSRSSIMKARLDNAAKPKVSNGIVKLESTQTEKQSIADGKKQPPEYQLLSNAMKIFKKNQCDKLRTRDLIASLCSVASPWRTYNKGQQITARQLGGLLKPYGVTSHDLYFADGNAKGYIKKEIRRAYRKLKVLHLSGK